MKIEYNLLETGWAEFTFRNSEKSIEVSASYLHDSLLELAEATLLLCKGSKEADVTFVEEPGHHRLILKRNGQDRINLKFQWFKEWPTRKEKPDQEVFKIDASLTELKEQVLGVLKHIEEQIGPDEYHKLWKNHEFPSKQYQRLRAI